jgi:hypothetical protein
MSFKAGTSQQDTSGTSTFTPDATLLGDLYNNLGNAQTLTSTPFQPYSGQMVAGFDPYQTQAQGGLADIYNSQVGSAPLSSAMGATQGLTGYAPQSVQAATMSAPQLSQANLSAYMNPYQSSVIDSTLADMARQQQIQSQANSTQATQAGAFGGSRSAVLQNLSDDSYDRSVASTLANLNQGNYSQAQAAAQSDLNRQMSANQANQGAAMQAALADQSAGLQGAGLNLNAAGSLANMSGQQLSQALQQAGALSSAGDAQQQNQQDQLNAAYQQWQLAQQYPIQMQELMNQTLGTIPMYGTTTSSGSTTGSSAQAGFNDGSSFNKWLDGLF